MKQYCIAKHDSQKETLQQLFAPWAYHRVPVEQTVFKATSQYCRTETYKACKSISKIFIERRTYFLISSTVAGESLVCPAANRPAALVLLVNQSPELNLLTRGTK